MKYHLGSAYLVWYLKFLALPLSIGVTMCGIFTRIVQRRRRAALEGKVMTVLNMLIMKIRNDQNKLKIMLQNVLITGASSGIGESLAHVFHEHGSKVILAARRKSELERVKQDLLSKNVCYTSIGLT